MRTMSFVSEMTSSGTTCARIASLSVAIDVSFVRSGRNRDITRVTVRASQGECTAARLDSARGARLWSCSGAPPQPLEARSPSMLEQEATVSYPSWDTIRNGTFVRTRNFPLIDADMPTFMGQPHAITPKDLEGADVVIIGAPYVASWQEYAGVSKSEWIAGPKRVRQQSIRYGSGYIQDFDLDVFEHVKLVDFGDAA